jgi:hypothetical protein
MNTAVMRVADLSRNMMEGFQLWRTHLTIIIMEDEDAGHSAAWYLDNFAQKAGIASPAALGHAFMDIAVTRVADFVKNMVEENQRANQQPTPSATAFSSSPVVTHPNDDEDDVLFLFRTPLQPTTSQRRYFKADRRFSSVASSLHESHTNKKRRLADPSDVIDLTDEPESVISDLTGQSLSPVPIQSNLAVF